MIVSLKLLLRNYLSVFALADQSLVDKRLRGIAIRQNLTDEWKERDIEHEKDFAILTAEISKATFGVTPAEYKNFKGLTKKNKI
jgi:DNA-damage-inducible protein D